MNDTSIISADIRRSYFLLGVVAMTAATHAVSVNFTENTNTKTRRQTTGRGPEGRPS